jgi:hypothetical protein
MTTWADRTGQAHDSNTVTVASCNQSTIIARPKNIHLHLLTVQVRPRTTDTIYGYDPLCLFSSFYTSVSSPKTKTDSERPNIQYSTLAFLSSFPEMATSAYCASRAALGETLRASLGPAGVKLSWSSGKPRASGRLLLQHVSIALQHCPIPLASLISQFQSAEFLAILSCLSAYKVRFSLLFCKL